MKTVDEWFKEKTGFELKGHWAEESHRETWAAALEQQKGVAPAPNKQSTPLKCNIPHCKEPAIIAYCQHHYELLE